MKRREDSGCLFMSSMGEIQNHYFPFLYLFLCVKFRFKRIFLVIGVDLKKYRFLMIIVHISYIIVYVLKKNSSFFSSGLYMSSFFESWKFIVFIYLINVTPT